MDAAAKCRFTADASNLASRDKKTEHVLGQSPGRVDQRPTTNSSNDQHDSTESLVSVRVVHDHLDLHPQRGVERARNRMP